MKQARESWWPHGDSGKEDMHAIPEGSNPSSSFWTHSPIRPAKHLETIPALESSPDWPPLVWKLCGEAALGAAAGRGLPSSLPRHCRSSLASYSSWEQGVNIPSVSRYCGCSILVFGSVCSASSVQRELSLNESTPKLLLNMPTNVLVLSSHA